MEDQKTIPFFDQMNPIQRIRWMIQHDPKVRAECDLVALDAKDVRAQLSRSTGISDSGDRQHAGLIPPSIYAAEWQWIDKQGSLRAFFKEFPEFRTGKIPPLQPAKLSI